MALCNTCDENWLIEACDLRTGRVRAIWSPISVRFDVGLNAITDCAVTLPTRDIALRDVWPGLTSVYISRVAGVDASRQNPVCEFAGIVTDTGLSESGATVVGIKSINWYLSKRNIRRDITLSERQQTFIGERLVAEQFHVLSGFSAIPLYSASEASVVFRDRTYEAWRRKNIWEAIEDLTQVENGPDWEFSHARTVDGFWSTTMIFRDVVGEDRGIMVRSDREASAYSVSIDAENLANLVDAYGAGLDQEQLIATASRATSIYPQFDATPVWNDVTRYGTLSSHAQGYVEANQEPDARPTATIPGLDVEPSMVRVGDTVTVEIGYGAISFQGEARIINIAWTIDADGPEFRTLELLPVIPVSQSMLNSPPPDIDCEPC